MFKDLQSPTWHQTIKGKFLLLQTRREIGVSRWLYGKKFLLWRSIWTTARRFSSEKNPQNNCLVKWQRHEWHSVSRDNSLFPLRLILAGEAEQDVNQPAQRQEPDLGHARSSGGPQPAQHGQCAGYGQDAGGKHHQRGEQTQLHLQHGVPSAEQPSV